MKISRYLAACLISSGLFLTACESNSAPHADSAPAKLSGHLAARPATFEQDRQAILKLSGAYEIAFHFEETTVLAPSYKPHKPDDTNALELVKVIEDSGDRIVMQHLLVVGEDQVVKHWREVWQYEETELLEFKGLERWERRSITVEEARGTWTQSVFEVDDSPRYSGYGKWHHEGTMVYWQSNLSWRPLPRREYTTRSDYQAIAAYNRVILTPTGWVHEQDNTKLVLDPKTRATVKALVREVGINTYDTTDAKDVAAAEAYWKRSAGFWIDVRAAWAGALPKSGPVELNRKVNGQPLNITLLTTCDEVCKDGKSDAPQTQALVEKMIRGVVVSPTTR